MLIVISPAKKLDFNTPTSVSDYTQPDHLDRAAELIGVMRQKDSFGIANLMKLSMNLASNEYFKSIRPGELKGRIVTPIFREYRKGAYRIISFNAKKARGYMSRFIIQNRVADPEDIKAFVAADYVFNPDLSSSNEFVFTR